MYRNSVLANVDEFPLSLDPGSALLLFVRGVRMSGAESDSGRSSSRIPYHVERAVTDLLQYVSSRLFSATAKDELVDMIDVTLEDDTFYVLSAAVGVAAKKARLADGVLRDDDTTRSAFTFVSSNNQGRLRLALSLTRWVELAKNSRPVRERASGNSERGDGDGTSETHDRSPAEAALGFMTDPQLPVEFKRALLGHAKARVCTLGVLATYYHATSPFIMEELIEEWIRGEKAYLQVLCAVTNTDIPDDVLPLRDRIDVSRVITLKKAAEDGYQAVLRAARTSCLDVFPMLGYIDE